MFQDIYEECLWKGGEGYRTGQRDSGVALVPRGLSLLAPWGALGQEGPSGESCDGGLYTSVPYTDQALEVLAGARPWAGQCSAHSHRGLRTQGLPPSGWDKLFLSEESSGSSITVHITGSKL